MEFLIVYFETVVAFLGTWAGELGAGAAVLAIVETVFSPFRRFMARFRKPEKVELINPPKFEETTPSEPILKMTLAQFEAKQRELRDQITEDLKTAHDAEKTRLQNALEAVNARLRDPEKALEEAQARIADLEQRLDREANRFGGDRINDAKKALRNLDYTKAEALFEEVEADAQIAVDAAARAAFGLGEIAEARVDWAKAADHYARAANLSADFERLRKASDYAERAGRYQEALVWSEKLYLWAMENGTPEHLATALNEQAINLSKSGRYAEAEQLFRQALEIDKATIGKAHPDYATHLNNLAGLLEDMGRYDDAEPLYLQALDIDKSTIGETHPDYATHLNNLAELLRAMRRYDEAEPLYRQTLEIDKATIGEAHPDYAIHLNNFALLLQAVLRFNEAEPLFRQARDISKASLGETHPDYATHLSNHSSLLYCMQRYTEAEPLMVKALRIREAALPADHPDIATSRQSLAAIRAKLAE